MSGDRHVPPGHHRNVAAFREHLRALDPAFDADETLLGAAGPLGAPLRVDGRVIGNRFCVQPMEGWDATTDGGPTERTLRRWAKFGRSGAKLVWGGEAFAVRLEGRANPNQLALGDDDGAALANLRALLGELQRAHREAGFALDDLVVGLQLTHSGRWSRPLGPKAPRTALRHAELDRRVEIADDSALFRDDELDALALDYARAAVIAKRAGFAFVDVKCCHGYLLHELLGARGRRGPHGGSFENRTRLFRAIVAAIRAAAPGLAIGVRLSVIDVPIHGKDQTSGIGRPLDGEPGAPDWYGFGIDAGGRPSLDEPLRFLRELRDLGIRLVNLTIGSPYTCPHAQRPAAYPPSDGYLPPEDPLLSVIRHLRVTRDVKRAVPELAIVGTGYSYLQEWLPHVAQHELREGHVDFIGLGRSMLSYPELPADVLRSANLDRRRICRTLSDCTTAPRKGLPSGCYPLDPEYRSSDEAKVLARLKQDAR